MSVPIQCTLYNSSACLKLYGKSFHMYWIPVIIVFSILSTLSIYQTLMSASYIFLAGLLPVNSAKMRWRLSPLCPAKSTTTQNLLLGWHALTISRRDMAKILKVTLLLLQSHLAVWSVSDSDISDKKSQAEFLAKQVKKLSHADILILGLHFCKIFISRE